MPKNFKLLDKYEADKFAESLLVVETCVHLKHFHRNLSSPKLSIYTTKLDKEDKIS